MRYLIIWFFIIILGITACNNKDETESNYFDSTNPFGGAGGIYATSN